MMKTSTPQSSNRPSPSQMLKSKQAPATPTITHVLNVPPPSKPPPPPPVSPPHKTTPNHQQKQHMDINNQENHYAVSHLVQTNRAQQQESPQSYPTCQVKSPSVQPQENIRFNSYVTGKDSCRNSPTKADDSTRGLPVAAQKLSVTGSFDPNDFDSFDEDDEFVQSSRDRPVKTTNGGEMFHIPLESIERIRQTAAVGLNVQQAQVEQQQQPQQQPPIQQLPMPLIQFDPNDFDSFDEDDGDDLGDRLPSIRAPPARNSPQIPQLPSISIDLSM